MAATSLEAKRKKLGRGRSTRCSIQSSSETAVSVSSEGSTLRASLMRRISWAKKPRGLSFEHGELERCKTLRTLRENKDTPGPRPHSLIHVKNRKHNHKFQSCWSSSSSQGWLFDTLIVAKGIQKAPVMPDWFPYIIYICICIPYTCNISVSFIIMLYLSIYLPIYLFQSKSNLIYLYTVYTLNFSVLDLCFN